MIHVDGQVRPVDRAIFVCSRNASWARATAKVLSVITSLDAHPLPDIKPERILECMHSVGKYPDPYSEDICLIHLPSSADRAARDGIVSVLRVRGAGEHWAGGIVLVVRSEQARASLACADLFGGELQGMNTIERRSTAHRILVEPIRTATLVAELSSVGQVWRLQWRRWLGQGPLGPLVRLLQKAQEHADAGSLEVARSCLANAHLLWRTQTERIHKLCDHGAMQKKTRTICDCRIMSAENVVMVIREMREVLIHIGVGA